MRSAISCGHSSGTLYRGLLIRQGYRGVECTGRITRLSCKQRIYLPVCTPDIAVSATSWTFLCDNLPEDNLQLAVPQDLEDMGVHYFHALSSAIPACCPDVPDCSTT